jgi:hypothetical protein
MFTRMIDGKMEPLKEPTVWAELIEISAAKLAYAKGTSGLTARDSNLWTVWFKCSVRFT